MSHATSDLAETRNTRLKPETSSASHRAPRVGDRVHYFDFDTEARAVVARYAEITELYREGDPQSRATLTVFTPAAPHGTCVVRNAPRGTKPDQWDFIGG